MSSMEPKTLDAFLGILDDIIANPLEKLVFWHIEATQIYLQHLNMLACGENSSDVAEKVIENLLFCEMAVAKALEFNVGDFGITCLICDVLFELFELLLAAEELSSAHMELCDLGGIKDESHLL